MKRYDKPQQFAELQEFGRHWAQTVGGIQVCNDMHEGNWSQWAFGMSWKLLLEKQGKPKRNELAQVHASTSDGERRNLKA